MLINNGISVGHLVFAHLSAKDIHSGETALSMSINPQPAPGPYCFVSPHELSWHVSKNLVGGAITILKNMTYEFVNGVGIIPYMKRKIIQMVQTTNQITSISIRSRMLQPPIFLGQSFGDNATISKRITGHSVATNLHNSTWKVQFQMWVDILYVFVVYI